MNVNWYCSDDYHRAKLETEQDKRDAIKQLIIKILELSTDKEEWNSIVLDKWIFNLGRLIGNIQNTNEAVGMDRGYRVELQFMDFYNRLENSGDDQYNQTIGILSEELENLIIDVFDEDVFKLELKKYHETHPFVVEIADQGQRVGIVLALV